MQSPPFVQISGGEPLTRPDVFDVVRAVRGSDRTRQIIFVTNGSLLDPATYHRLREAGVSRMSVSLDFPDERHDAFRKIPGLFQHLSQILPEIARRNGGGCAVALNTAITSANFREIVQIAHVAHQWGVGVSYSAYTTMKTGDLSFMLSAAEVRAVGAYRGAPAASGQWVDGVESAFASQADREILRARKHPRLWCGTTFPCDSP